MLAKSKLTANPKRQLDSFLGKHDPAIAALARRILVKLRKRLPGAVEMVYDNYNGLAVGFGPSDKPSLAIFSIVLFLRWVTLCFLRGAGSRTLKGVFKARAEWCGTSAWKISLCWTIPTFRA